MKRQLRHEVRSADVGRAFGDLPGCAAMEVYGFGQVLACDVGKRIYLVEGMLQMENNEGRDRRTAAPGLSFETM